MRRIPGVSNDPAGTAPSVGKFSAEKKRKRFAKRPKGVILSGKSGYSAAWFSAFDWGSKGREFESLYPDHFFAFFPEKGKKMVNEACQGFASCTRGALHALRRRRKALHGAKHRFIYHIPPLKP